MSATFVCRSLRARLDCRFEIVLSATRDTSKPRAAGKYRTRFRACLGNQKMKKLQIITSACSLVLALVAPRFASAECGGTVTTTYRLIPQTVYEQKQITAYRLESETVYDDKPVTSYRPIMETQMQERRYTVARPVMETSEREERYTVRKQVWDTVVEDRSYDRVRSVYETAEREERYMVARPVYETSEREERHTVRRQIVEGILELVGIRRIAIAETNVVWRDHMKTI